MREAVVVTSDEINFLVYRYLKESGFDHSAYTFGTESGVLSSRIDGKDVPLGTLVSYIQKGLQYKRIDFHINEDGTERPCDEPFLLIKPHVCAQKIKTEDDDFQAMEEDEQPATPASVATAGDVVNSGGGGVSGGGGGSGGGGEQEIARGDVTLLRGHSSEVFICAWNPRQPLLASGSGDSTARIWHVPDGPSGAHASAAGSASAKVLKHSLQVPEKNKDVTTLDWNHSGTLLATGSFDGMARVWNGRGELLSMLQRHKGPIFSLKWNKRGDYLLSGSVDKTAVIWNAATGEVKQQFEFHTAATLDVDWRDNISFATCSTDKTIYVCELSQSRPITCFQGHTDEVNAIKWSPTGRLLASCSDDYSAKIWRVDSPQPVCDFREHKKEIYTIKWSPTGPGTANPNKKLLLASASFDALIKLWDVEAAKCVFSLDRHADPVYSVAFSPNGEYLASGSFDRCLHIWSVKDGSLVRTLRGEGGIFEVCWNPAGDRVAACFSTNSICVLDFRM